MSTFLAVAGCGTITGAARQMRVTPSQVSKAMARLEATIGVRLLARGSRGVTLSDAGRKIVPHMERVIGELGLAHAAIHRAPLLTVAGPSSIIGPLLPVIANADPAVRVRGLALTSAIIRALMAEHHFDLALLSSAEDTLPPAWVRVSVGPVRRALFAPKALSKRLGPLPVSVEKVRSVPFVVPVHDTDGRFLAGEDDCPLPIRDRTIGHEAQSIGTALELAARTEQLVFCPTMSARPYVEAGWLVEVPVEGWAVEDPLFVACDGNRVMSQTLKRVVAALEVAVAEKDPSPPSRRRG